MTHQPDPAAITSAANPRIRALVRLREKPAERRAAERFSVESQRELLRALDARFTLLELYATRGWLEASPAAARAAPFAHRLFQISDRALQKAAYRHSPEGFIAVLAARRTTLDELLVALPSNPLLAVCAGLEKPGNVGAVVRCADAAGAHAVLLDDPRTDLYNPNTIRASTGAVFSTPVACAPPNQIIPALGDRSIRIIALSADAPEIYTAADLTRPFALVVGAEAQGLPPDWRDAADQHLSIPLAGSVDSLNASVAAALGLFEAVRQRRATTPPKTRHDSTPQ